MKAQKLRIAAPPVAVRHPQSYGAFRIPNSIVGSLASRPTECGKDAADERKRPEMGLNRAMQEVFIVKPLQVLEWPAQLAEHPKPVIPGLSERFQQS